MAEGRRGAEKEFWSGRSEPCGSDFLKDQSQTWEDEANLAEEDDDVNYERVAPSGNRALALPSKDRAAAMREEAATAAPASTPIPTVPG